MQQDMENTLSTIEPWFSVEEISRHLGVSKETVYRWLDRKKIPAHRIGRLWKFKPSEVDQWIKSGEAVDDEKSQFTNILDKTKKISKSLKIQQTKSRLES